MLISKKQQSLCKFTLLKILTNLQLLPISLHFFCFFENISLLDPDLDPGGKMNADPDPQPCFKEYKHLKKQVMFRIQICIEPNSFCLQNLFTVLGIRILHKSIFYINYFSVAEQERPRAATFRVATQPNFFLLEPEPHFLRWLRLFFQASKKQKPCSCVKHDIKSS